MTQERNPAENPTEKKLEIKDLFLMEIFTDFMTNMGTKPDVAYFDGSNYCLLSFGRTKTNPFKFGEVPVVVSPMMRFYPKDWKYVEQPKA
jgi:hypothetical protein